MNLNIKGYIVYNLKELLFKGHLIIGLICALFPAILISYFIIEKSTPFTIKHISNFYCMLGMLCAVLASLSPLNKDYSSKTISLINNTSHNRNKYIISVTLVTIIISIIYIMIGVVFLYIVKYLDIPGTLNISFILGFSSNVFLLVLFYFLLGALLILYRVHIGIVYTLLTASLLFIHNIFANMLETLQNETLKNFIENFPFYYLPALVGSKPFSVSQYLITVILIILIFSFVIRKNRKLEY
ncbi:ABC transporter permease [Staphylococcus equorum]|uniref:ABC transporter permease n=1 Tax=Staphylococcus equorum TaxID=246432 RepID=A0A9X4L379_9STAP|nr:ABC transporter permease [Staphylococcus equorum]MDG0819667.1 ABC transporter permease [Staphylococcus equorum]MDG0840308.1 ABC transporter permease [Staphylococcus equorum]MDG0845991.1 ABC transporter permease [Staphylococcus equorum]